MSAITKSLKLILTKYVEQSSKSLQGIDEINALYKLYKPLFRDLLKTNLNLKQLKTALIYAGAPQELADFIGKEMEEGNYPGFSVENSKIYIKAEALLPSANEVYMLKSEDSQKEDEVVDIDIKLIKSYFPDSEPPQCFYEKIAKLFERYQLAYSKEASNFTNARNSGFNLLPQRELLVEEDRKRHWLFGFCDHFIAMLKSQESYIKQIPLVLERRRKSSSPLETMHLESLDQIIEKFKIHLCAHQIILLTLHLRNWESSPAILGEMLNDSILLIMAETKEYFEGFNKYFIDNCSESTAKKQNDPSYVLHHLSLPLKECVAMISGWFSTYLPEVDHVGHLCMNANSFDEPLHISKFSKFFNKQLELLENIQKKTKPQGVEEQIYQHPALPLNNRNARRLQKRIEVKKKSAPTKFSNSKSNPRNSSKNHIPILVGSNSKELASAWHLLKDERHNEAKDKFLAIQERIKNPQSDTYCKAQYGLACLALVKKEYQRARQYLETLPELWQNCYVVQRDLLRCYEHQEEFTKAIHQALKMLQLWQDDPFLLYTIAQCYVSMGNVQGAIAIHLRLYHGNPSSNVLMNLTYFYIRANDYTQALWAFNQLDYELQSDSFLMLTKAYCYHQLGMEEERLAVLQQGRLADPTNLKFLSNYAEALIKNEHFDMALDQLKEAREQFPNNATVATLFAFCYYQRSLQELNNHSHEDLASALANLKMIKNNPVPALDILRLQIKIYLALNKFENAKQCCHLLQESYPQASYSYLEALTYEIRKFEDEEEKASKKRPQSAKSRSTKSSSVNLLQFLQKFETTLKKFPDSLAVYLKKAKFLLALPELESSTKSFLDKLALKFPNEPRVYNLRGLYFIKLKEYHLASQELEQALSSFPESPHLHLTLYSCYLRQGNFGKAEHLKDKMKYLFQTSPKILTEMRKLQAQTVDKKQKEHNPALEKEKEIEDYSASKGQESEVEELPSSLERQVLVSAIPRVNYPPLIKKIFNWFDTVTKHSYLTGPAVFELFQPQKNLKFKELHFLSYCDKEKLLANGFLVHPTQPNVYSARIFFEGQDVLIRVLVCENYLQNYYLDFERNESAQGFRLCSLLMDKHAYLMHSSNFDIKDLQKGILSTYQSAQTVFSRDPVQILNVVSYITKGLKPTLDLHQAMLCWSGEKHQIFPYYGLIVNQLLNHLESLEDPVAYLKLLYDYQILQKLFDITSGLESIETFNKSYVDVFKQFLVKEIIELHQIYFYDADFFEPPIIPLLELSDQRESNGLPALISEQDSTANPEQGSNPYGFFNRVTAIAHVNSTAENRYGVTHPLPTKHHRNYSSGL